MSLTLSKLICYSKHHHVDTAVNFLPIQTINMPDMFHLYYRNQKSSIFERAIIDFSTKLVTDNKPYLLTLWKGRGKSGHDLLNNLRSPQQALFQEALERHLALKVICKRHFLQISFINQHLSHTPLQSWPHNLRPASEI